MLGNRQKILACIGGDAIITTWKQETDRRKNYLSRVERIHTMLYTAWKIQSNAKVHGIQFAATYAAKNGINLDTVLYALFGKYSSRKG